MIRTGDILSIGLVLQAIFVIKLVSMLEMGMIWKVLGVVGSILIFISELVYAWQKFGGKHGQ